ncbi:tetratricopeptide repeat protein [Modestobacter marinus]|uniref:tetratricopeptide repeat protein n=1 Tax=Modestobacter marinus TaxID=477641 RepID=UPI00166B29A3|nr:tetratricopeptide repeat protein [Modestobacter marinus]
MRGPVTEDDIEEIGWAARTPAAHLSAAAWLQAAATDPHPEDEVGPAELYVAASDQLSFAGDTTGALALCRAAVSAGGHVPPDVRVFLHHALLAAGDGEEARTVAEDIRRSRPGDLAVYSFLGESYEVTGDLGQAHRWFTLGLQRALSGSATGGDPSELPRGSEGRMLGVARTRVRRDLEMPPDELDDAFT